MERDKLFCVVCSAQITQHTDPPPPADNSLSSSENYLYFSQFCAELEKCGGGVQSGKSFNNNNFFHSVDTACSYLLACQECTQLVSEAMEISLNLEKWEMEVLKWQIELLMKLKELENCNDNYFSGMSRIYDKVINSSRSVKDDDLDEEEGIINFEHTSLSKDDVNLFREKILDVVPTLALFRDDLKRKLVKPFKSPAPPSSDAGKEEEMETADDFPPMQIANFKDDPVTKEDNGSSDNGNDDTNYQDNHEATDSESDLQDDLKPEVPKKKTKKKKFDPKISPIFENLPPLPFPIPGASSNKKLLIQTTLIPPSPSTSPTLQPPYSTTALYTYFLQSYPWNYDPTSDILTLGNPSIPITVVEGSEENQGASISLKCSTCYFSVVSKPKKHINNQKRSLFAMVRKIFEHVVSNHLEGFKCPFAGVEVGRGKTCGRKRGTLKVLVTHLSRAHIVRKESLFHCSVCGKGLATLKDCLLHEETHKEKGQRDHVTCETCGVSLLRRNLVQHKKLFCGGRRAERRSVCQICGRSFSKERTIKDHMLRKHAGVEEKRFGCDVEGCRKRYGVKLDLRNHKISKHGIYPEGMGMECRKGCGKRFTWQSNLCKHEDKCDGIRVEPNFRKKFVC